ncbi:hypothetical protein BDR06DRAFT_970725 [Suillus hirtellus]|nr:hypothetical protein BDR06DRAFT_970725 [Suillus hirtellus]
MDLHQKGTSVIIALPTVLVGQWLVTFLLTNKRPRLQVVQIELISAQVMGKKCQVRGKARVAKQPSHFEGPSGAQRNCADELEEPTGLPDFCEVNLGWRLELEWWMDAGPEDRDQCYNCKTACDMMLVLEFSTVDLAELKIGDYH